MFVLVVFSINLWEIFSLFSVKVSYIALLGRFAFNMHYFYPNIFEKGYVNAKRGKWIWEYWQADNKKVARGLFMLPASIMASGGGSCWLPHLPAYKQGGASPTLNAGGVGASPHTL